VLAVVTAVHPTDRFVVSSTTWRAPRKFFVQARSAETGAHYRLGKAAKITGSVRWVIGSVDLVLFDARTATFTGPELERVPLYLVNGAGRSAALLQAKLVAQAELFRLFADDLRSVSDAALNRLASASDPEQLASLLCEWPSSIGMEACDEVIEHLLGLQEAAEREALLQQMVASRMCQQHGGVSLEDLSGQGRFPDKLPDKGVSSRARVLQDYDPDPHIMDHFNRIARNDSGVLRTDYLLW
jgi:hypothetical protein